MKTKLIAASAALVTLLAAEPTTNKPVVWGSGGYLAETVDVAPDPDYTAATLSIEPRTNWTGFTTTNGELGLVTEDHIIGVGYRGTTNRFTLLSVDTGRHVWRHPAATWWITNSLIPTPWPKIIVEDL